MSWRKLGGRTRRSLERLGTRRKKYPAGGADGPRCFTGVTANANRSTRISITSEVGTRTTRSVHCFGLAAEVHFETRIRIRGPRQLAGLQVLRSRTRSRT